MFKKIVSCIILIQFIVSCNNDDNSGGVTYLSPEEQKVVDTSGIELLLQDYYLNSTGDITAFTSCDTDGDGDCDSDDDCDTDNDGDCDVDDNCDINGDGVCDSNDIVETTETPLKDLVQPLSNGAYYYIIEGKQGSGTNPDTNDSILLNYGVTYFQAYNSDNEVKLNQIGRLGTIYSGIEAVERPSFYYYDFDTYTEATYGDQWDFFNADERQNILNFYNDNDIYERNVVTEFVEGIQKFKDRQETINSSLDVQGVIIAPSPNSKGLESYLSLGGISKDYILVFNVDLLSITKVENP
ncbi:hypothetical protein UJ101_00940 [Flavobacteriaceae bacterium UJ101]|nr:hypothetical protein UJ101_00940 [Flavobacteriaceae bacterium UJ101]